jgi:hypothetical protein
LVPLIVALANTMMLVTPTPAAVLNKPELVRVEV